LCPISELEEEGGEDEEADEEETISQASMHPKRAPDPLRNPLDAVNIIWAE